MVDARTSIAQNLRLSSLPAGIKALSIEWLQEVIQRMHLKRANRVVVVSRNENDPGELFRVKEFKHVETAKLRHLDIKKNKIW